MDAAPEIVRVGRGAPELWLVAGVHGDEVEGVGVVEEALRSIVPDRGTLVAVPVAHPAALAAGTRTGPDGRDLNRTYPGRADGSPTERVAHALWEAIPDGAGALLTFHSWSRCGAAAPYVEHATGDARSRALAHRLGLPFVEAWDWPDGLLPRHTSERGIPSVELELLGLGRHTAGGLQAGMTAARAAARWLGMLDGAAETVPPASDVRRRWLTAPVAGRARQLAALGERVPQGAPLVELRGLRGETLATVTAPAPGAVGVHVTYGHVGAGAPVAVLFESVEG